MKGTAVFGRLVRSGAREGWQVNLVETFKIDSAASSNAFGGTILGAYFGNFETILGPFWDHFGLERCQTRSPFILVPVGKNPKMGLTAVCTGFDWMVLGVESIPLTPGRHPPNVPLLRSIGSSLVGIQGVFKGSWGWELILEFYL